MDWTELYIMHYIYIIYFIIIIVCAMTRVVEYVHTSPGQTPSHWTTTNRVSPLTQTLHGSINQVSGLARTSAMVHPIRSLHSHEPPVVQPIRSLHSHKPHPWDNQSGLPNHMNSRWDNQSGLSPPKWTLVGQPIRSLHPNEPWWDNQSGLSNSHESGCEGVRQPLRSPPVRRAALPQPAAHARGHQVDALQGHQNIIQILILMAIMITLWDSHWCKNPILYNKNPNPILTLCIKRFSVSLPPELHWS